MSRLQLTFSSLCCAMFLGGCATDFTGMWLFQWDLSKIQSETNGNCPELDERKLEGDDYEWIDIYTTTGGALVLTNGEQEWLGTVSEDSFSVSTTSGESDGSDYYFHWTEEIVGTLNGDEVSGRSDEYEISCYVDQGCEGQSNECERSTRRKYKAAKIEDSEESVRALLAQSTALRATESPEDGSDQ